MEFGSGFAMRVPSKVELSTSPYHSRKALQMMDENQVLFGCDSFRTGGHDMNLRKACLKRCSILIL